MNIPADLYESARIDAASPFTMYFKITLRYILFVMGPSLITQFIGNFNNFGIIYLLSGGGPTTGQYYASAGKTDILVTWLYKLSINQGKYNLAAVVGIIIFLISATLSLIVYRNSASFKNEEDFA
jgi:arabinogalactan oligomer/maltooligosaccharide transport system permease protein